MYLEKVIGQKLVLFNQHSTKFLTFINIINYQPLHNEMQTKTLKFVQEVDSDLIENLPNNGTKYLLIFDVSCEDTGV